jgi:hypothetical protein
MVETRFVIRESYMSPPDWIVIQNGKSKTTGGHGVSEGGIAPTRKQKIQTFAYIKGALYRKDSIFEAISLINDAFISSREMSGNSYQTFKKKSYHKFSGIDAFIFIDEMFLPDNLKEKLRIMREKDDE